MADTHTHPSDDPRLSAYLFDEMKPEARAQFEKELASDPELKAALSQLRQISSMVGRAFAEEPVPKNTSGVKSTGAETAPRKLSARARSGRVSRFKQDIPKINTSVKNRYAAFAGAAAAAVVLAGLVTLQSVIVSSGGDEDQATYVPLTTTKQGDYVKPMPLANQIAQEVAAESAAYAAQLDAVTNEVALGLADSLEAESSLFLGLEGDTVENAEVSARRYDLDIPRPEISLQSTFAERPIRARSSAASPRVMLRNDRAGIVAPVFQSTDDFQSSRIPLHVTASDLSDVRRQIEQEQDVGGSEVNIASLLNAFDFSHLSSAKAGQNSLFDLDLEVAQSPWNRVHYLVRLTLESSQNDAQGDAQVGSETKLLAEDVRLEVKFNPEQIAAYRLLGYEPEVVTSDEIFAEPGESIASGHQLTVLYEVIPVGSPVPSVARDGEDRFEIAVSRGAAGQRGMELLWAHIEYSLPADNERRSLEEGLVMPAKVPSWHGASRAFQWAAAVASFGMEILDDPLLTGADWELIEALAESGAGEQSGENYLEFISMIEKARSLE